MFAARAGDRVGNRGYGANTYTAVVRLAGDCYVVGGSPRAKKAVFGTGGELERRLQTRGEEGDDAEGFASKFVTAEGPGRVGTCSCGKRDERVSEKVVLKSG